MNLEKSHQCKLACPATRAAFLALMALKLKNKEICEQKTSNDPNDVKKLFNFGIDDPLAFGLDFTTFVGLL